LDVDTLIDNQIATFNVATECPPYKVFARGVDPARRYIII